MQTKAAHKPDLRTGKEVTDGADAGGEPITCAEWTFEAKGCSPERWDGHEHQSALSCVDLDAHRARFVSAACPSWQAHGPAEPTLMCRVESCEARQRLERLVQQHPRFSTRDKAVCRGYTLCESIGPQPLEGWDKVKGVNRH